MVAIPWQPDTQHGDVMKRARWMLGAVLVGFLGLCVPVLMGYTPGPADPAIQSTGMPIGGAEYGTFDGTGNEEAFTLSYTTNKPTSGNHFGLHIDWTDTAMGLPGYSYPFVVSKDGSPVFYLVDVGGANPSMFTGEVSAGTTLWFRGSNGTIQLLSGTTISIVGPSGGASLVLDGSIAASPAEPHVCGASTEAAVFYVRDTSSGAGELCICAYTGATFDWVQVANMGAACTHI